MNDAAAITVMRSVLYMPASNTRALEKAKGLACDALIFDLEDAVAPAAKEEARENAAAAVRSRAYGNRTVAIRANGLDTPWGHDDLRAAAGAAPDGILLPKVRSTDDLEVAIEIIDSVSDARIPLWAMMETPEAVLEARSIAAFPRLSVLVVGTNDLVNELRVVADPGRSTLLPHLSTIVLAARAANVIVVDGVYNDVTNVDGFASECALGFAHGFDGKTLIHPNQIETCNQIWAPSDDAIADAHRVVAAFEEAQAEGRGVTTLDGRMIENLHVDAARRVLAVAEVLDSGPA